MPYKVIKLYNILYSYGRKILVYVLTFAIAGMVAFGQFCHNSDDIFNSLFE